jgi:hypothetical protein
VHTSSLAARIIAWYDWLLVILILVLGAYTCKCLDYCLSTGLQNSLSIQAKEIARRFAATGQIPGSERFSGPGIKSGFISVDHQSGGPEPDSSRKPESQPVVPGHVRREPNWLPVPARVVHRTAHDARFLIATAGATFKNKEYFVRVGVPKRPMKVVFRETAIRMLIGLVVGLAVATWGSFSFIKRALLPVQKIGLAVQALPVVHPDERIKPVVVLEEIASLCITVNDMLGQLEKSFQIGTGLPIGAFHAPSTPLGTVRGELANFFENETHSVGVANTILCLLEETERLSDISRNLVTPSCKDTRPTRIERLSFYLDGLAASRVEHICLLTKKLGADLASEARGHSCQDNLVRW